MPATSCELSFKAFWWLRHCSVFQYKTSLSIWSMLLPCMEIWTYVFKLIRNRSFNRSHLAFSCTSYIFLIVYPYRLSIHVGIMCACLHLPFVYWPYPKYLYRIVYKQPRKKALQNKYILKRNIFFLLCLLGICFVFFICASWSCGYQLWKTECTSAFFPMRV